MAPSSPHAPWRVLVVDDDPDVHPLLEALLQIDGRFTIVGQASDGAGALALADRNRPDAVVLDLSVPGGVDAWDALPELHRLLPHARIVVFSAFPEAVSLVEALTSGADAYLNKASAWELVPVLAELLTDGYRPPVGTGC